MRLLLTTRLLVLPPLLLLMMMMLMVPPTPTQLLLRLRTKRGQEEKTEIDKDHPLVPMTRLQHSSVAVVALAPQTRQQHKENNRLLALAPRLARATSPWRMLVGSPHMAAAGGNGALVAAALAAAIDALNCAS